MVDVEETTVWAFVVGVNSEWPYNRISKGDVALVRAFRSLTTSTTTTAATVGNGANGNRNPNDEDRVVFVGDLDAVLPSTKVQFRSFLQRIAASRATSGNAVKVVFYFGGHGANNHFCLPNNGPDEKHDSSDKSSGSGGGGDGCWYHAEIVDAIEEFLLPGDDVWMLIDTCYSGGFVHAFNSNAQQRRCKASYCVLMSTDENSKAGPEWTLTDSWMTAMRRGKHSAVTSRQVIESMQQRIAQDKRDQMQWLVVSGGFQQEKNDRLLDEPFPFCFTVVAAAAAAAAGPATSLLRSGPSRHENRTGCWALWPCSWLAPLWARKRGSSSNVENSRQLKFDIMMPMVLYLLARNCGQYRSYAIPAGTLVWATWHDDDVLYQGRVVTDGDVPWHQLLLVSSDNGMLKLLEDKVGDMGPFVPMRWVEEGTWSLVPLAHCVCVVNDSADTFPISTTTSPPLSASITICTKLPTAAMVTEQARRRAQDELMHIASSLPCDCRYSAISLHLLKRSMESAGKELQNATDVVGSVHLECCLDSYGNEKTAWCRATAVSSLDDLDDAAADIALASHVHYEEKGIYCLVRTNATGDYDCLPASRIRALA